MTTATESVRAFVAVLISPAAKTALRNVVGLLKVDAPGGVRWIDPEGIHLTLKFLGNVGPARVPEIAAAMRGGAQGAPLFRLHLSGLGMFPNEKRPRVLWAGVQGDLDSLQELQGRIEDGLAGLGFPREGRPFRAHLTLGRVRDQASGEERRQINAAMLAVSLEATENWLVETVCLVQSHLSPSGATYSTLASASLGGEEYPS